MPITKKTYKDRKLLAAARAVTAARATVTAARGRYAGPSPRSFSRFAGSGELKVIENASAAINPVLAAGNVVAYNLVAQGTDFTNRIGRQIMNKSILFRASVQNNQANDTPGDIVRIMLIYDDQPNSAVAVPAVTDILTTADIFSGINLNNRDRFKVLYDKRFTLPSGVYSAGTLTVGSPVPKYVEKFIKLNHPTIFSGTGGTIASIGSGSLLMLNLSTQNTATTLTHYARVRFTDS
jgi:hypothetical protein